MKFWLPWGSFFNDFSTLKISLYTPANEVAEVYWFHHNCLSVCPSVCPSVKSGFCTITPLPFDIQWWYFTYMLTLTLGGPLLILGQKVKGQIRTLNFFTVSAPQLHLHLAYNNDTSQMYWPRPENDLYWFWGQRIKGQGHIMSLNFLSFPHDIHLFLAYNNDTSQMYWPWPEKDLSRFGVNRLKLRVKCGL